MKMSEVTLSQESQTFLRGSAIVAVVLIHFFSSLSHVYTRPVVGEFFIFFDQAARFSVPLFIMLSGFGLTKKYLDKKLVFKEFFERRVFKLFPLFFIWSLFSFCVLATIPAWNIPYTALPSVLSQLVLGSSDYQLYFLPLIFQLYILFPVLLKLLRAAPKMILSLVFGIQVALFVFFSSNALTKSIPFFLTDHGQYIFFLSWIFYFVCGMWLAAYGFPTKLKRWLPTLAFCGLVAAYLISSNAIAHGTDPLFALKATRLAILPWIILSTITLVLFTQSSYWHKLPTAVQKLVSWMGAHSYLIFLSHTLLLRMIFAFVRETVSPLALIEVFVAWAICVAVSLKLKE